MYLMRRFLLRCQTALVLHNGLYLILLWPTIHPLNVGEKLYCGVYGTRLCEMTMGARFLVSCLSIGCILYSVRVSVSVSVLNE